MSALEATPGPLELRASSTPSGNYSFHLYLADANGRKLAALWGGNDEKLANGYLWSSATSLYLALVETVCELEAALAGENDLSDTPVVIAKANTALAKARGEQ